MHATERELADANNQSLDGVAALRLLYSALDVREHCTYDTFLAQMDGSLRRSVRLWDVLIFLRQKAGLRPDEHCVIVWALDEVNAVRGNYQGTLWVAQLLSAVVKAHERARLVQNGSKTLLVCIMASTMWSSTQLLGTATQKARIVDLQLVPLSVAHRRFIFNNVCQRLLPPAASAQLANPGQWPSFDLRSSSALPDTAVSAGCDKVLQLSGGIPRTLAYAMAVMSSRGHNLLSPGNHALMKQSTCLTGCTCGAVYQHWCTCMCSTVDGSQREAA
jgi:hypothetical protein